MVYNILEKVYRRTNMITRYSELKYHDMIKTKRQTRNKKGDENTGFPV